MQTLDELIVDGTAALDRIKQCIDDASHSAELLPSDVTDGGRSLLSLQVTTGSALGAMAYHCGGLLIDHGWLRVLGTGHPRLARSLADWNRVDGPADQHRLPGAILIADDAVGGFFAVNGNALHMPTGHVAYLSPDTCKWDSLEMGYTDWIEWTLSPVFDTFYEDTRWPGWQDELATLDAGQALAVYPPLWAAGVAIARRLRGVVPVEEIWELHAVAYARKLNGGA